MFRDILGRGPKAYQPVQTDEDHELKSGMSTPTLRSSEEDQHELILHLIQQSRRPSWRSKCFLIAHMLLAVVNIVAVVALSDSRGFPWQFERNHHQRAVFEHSPLFDRMDIDLKTVQFDGSVYNSPNSSIFRKPPSDEVDLAWLSISDIKVFLADRKDIVKAGIDPDKAVRAPSSWNVGEKFVVQLDGPHQLHCLDLLRRQAYAKHYYPEGNDWDAFYWAHMSHCLDSLRQSLMCSSSVDILPLQFVQGEVGATFDFNTKHKCRDHYAILEWAASHSVDWAKMGAIPMPNDYIPVPAEEEFYDYLPATMENGHSKILHPLLTGNHQHHH